MDRSTGSGENRRVLNALFILRKAIHDFDALVKLLIQTSGAALRQLELGPVTEWLNVELPKTQTRRVDLLGRMAGGRLLQIELQSTNDRLMPFRMAEYALAILRKYGEYPVQLVIYVGNPRLRMKPEFRAEGMLCWYRQVDIRDLDSAALLRSKRIADNILAVLAGLDDTAGGIRMILRNIMKLRKPLREPVLQQLLLTCGLRDLEQAARKELRAMPTNIDGGRILMKYDFIREAFDKLVAEEVDKRVEARVRKQVAERVKQQAAERMEQVAKQVAEQVQEREKRVVQLLLEKRFGKLPVSVTRRLAKLSSAQTEKLALAMMDAKSLKDLFPVR